MNHPSNLTSDLRDLLSDVEALEQRETEQSRAAYRALLFRLAKGEQSEEDSPGDMHRLVKQVGRTAQDLVKDVEELRDLLLLAERARPLSELREADRQAALALQAGEVEHRRALEEIQAKLAALQRERDQSAHALYAADEARRALLQRLRLDDAYQQKLDALARAGNQDEAERCRQEVWEVWERALALSDHDPFALGGVEDQ